MMGNPFNPLDWFDSAKGWFSKAERSSGFRPYLIYLILTLSFGLVLLWMFPDRKLIEALATVLIGVPVLAFLPLYFWKARVDPDFCRSETHVQKLRKIELEMMGTESKQIPGEVIEHSALTDIVKEPVLVDSRPQPGADR